MTYQPLTAPADRPTLNIDAPAATACAACETTLPPDGTCLEIGACEIADSAATRASRAGRTAKYAVPAAWNARGSVD